MFDIVWCAGEQDEYDKQVSQLTDLINIINGELTPNERKKLITLCTIDVHARDVITRLMEVLNLFQSCAVVSLGYIASLRQTSPGGRPLRDKELELWVQQLKIGVSHDQQPSTCHTMV